MRARSMLVLVGAASRVLPLVVGSPAAGSTAMGATTRSAADGVSAAAAGAARSPLCFPMDNGNPRVAEMSISPATVDIRPGSQFVMIRVRPVDTGGPGAPTGVLGGRLFLGFSPQPGDLAVVERSRRARCSTRTVTA